jgi:predicted glycoside hydrolase/deacetylase ChbG (UPF0249 family)
VKRLIVNADDYGLCAGVDRGIRELAARGAVTSVSVMALRASRESVEALVDRAPAVGLGLHVDFTADLMHYAPGDLERRLRQQVDRFVALAGRPPDHLDTHKQLHRDHDEVLGALLGVGLPLRAPDQETRRIARERGCRCPDHFIGGVGTRPYWTWARLQARLRALRPGVTELMCHPGYGDGMPDGLRYTTQRLGEQRTFLRDDLPDLLRQLGIEAVSYRALAAGGA